MKRDFIYNIICCIICSPLLYLFIRGFMGRESYLLLLPLPLLVSKSKYLTLGLLLSTILTIILTLLIGERQLPFRFVPFPKWVERIIICIQLGIVEFVVFALKCIIAPKLFKKIKMM